MKTKLAAAVLLSLAAGTTFAAPTFYGEIDLTIDYLPEDNAVTTKRDVIELTTNNSFIGLKGDEKLNDRLSALYQAEFTFFADNGGGTDTFVPRNLLVGLKDEQFGTVKLGKIDTPLKQLSGVVDTFNNYINNNADIAGIMTGENRIDNVVVYEAPNLDVGAGKLKATALLASGEASGIASSKGGAKTAGRGLGDAWSASVVYDSKPVVVGIAYDKAIPSSFIGRSFLNSSDPEVTAVRSPRLLAAANTIRAIGRVNVAEGLAIKALYQTSEVENVAGNAAAAANIDEANGWLLGAEYKVPATNWTAKAQYSQNTTEFKAGAADYEAQQLIFGADYAISKQVKAYGYLGYSLLEQGNLETQQPVLGTGVEYRF